MVAYRLLTGRVPFTGKSAMEILQKHVKQPAPPLRLLNSGISEEVEQVVLRALSKKPGDRPPTTVQFAAEFAGRLREPRDVAVEHVEEHRDDEEPPGPAKARVDVKGVLVVHERPVVGDHDLTGPCNRGETAHAIA